MDAYRALLLQGLTPTPSTTVALDQCAGYTLAEDVQAPWSLPSFDNSSMDGYAVRHDDVVNAPVRLSVLGDIAAGHVSDIALESGQCMRIMTGAPVPAGTTAVVPVELTDGGADQVVINQAVDAGAYIRCVGDDVTAGTVVLTAGTTITPRQIALLAACSIDQVVVHRKPRVTVVSTGDELIDPGQIPTSGTIVDANSYLLLAAVEAAGGVATRVKVADDEQAFLQVILDAAQSSDLILTSGGVSMGVYDTVKAALGARGGVSFCKIAMQPGMPQGHGQITHDGSTVPIITLPGNPVSAYVSFEQFVRPVLRAMSGAVALLRPVTQAIMTQAMTSPSGKRQFARGVVSGVPAQVRPVGGQGSHVVGGLAQANCLIDIPDDVVAVSVGTTVSIIDLREDA